MKIVKSSKAKILFAGVAMSLSPLSHSNAFAEGGSVGNGGNAKVCFKGRPEIAKRLTTGINGVVAKMIPDSDLRFISSVETLDLVEAKRPKGVDRSVPELIDLLPGEKPWEFAKRITQPFDLFEFREYSLGETLSKVLERGIDSFEDRIYFSPESAVFPINDIRPLESAGDECIYATVAVQRGIGKGKRELMIDGRLYDRMSELSRAVLFTHEYYLSSFSQAVYRAQTTEGLREFTAAMIQKNRSIGVLIGIIERRNLKNNDDLEDMTTHFGRSNLSVHIPSIVKVMRQILKEYNEAWDVLAKDQSILAEFKAEVTAVSHWKNLPSWYVESPKIGHSLTRQYPQCVLKKLSSRKETCLIYEAGYKLYVLNRFKEKWIEDHFPKELVSRLSGMQESREQRFNQSLADLEATGVVAPEVILEIRNALKSFVQTGVPRQNFFVGKYFRLQVELKKPEEMPWERDQLRWRVGVDVRMNQL